MNVHLHFNYQFRLWDVPQFFCVYHLLSTVTKHSYACSGEVLDNLECPEEYVINLIQTFFTFSPDNQCNRSEFSKTFSFQ